MPPKKKEEVKTKPLLGRFKSNLKVRLKLSIIQTVYTVDAMLQSIYHHHVNFTHCRLELSVYPMWVRVPFLIHSLRWASQQITSLFAPSTPIMYVAVERMFLISLLKLCYLIFFNYIISLSRSIKLPFDGVILFFSLSTLRQVKLPH